MSLKRTEFLQERNMYRRQRNALLQTMRRIIEHEEELRAKGCGYDSSVHNLALNVIAGQRL